MGYRSLGECVRDLVGIRTLIWGTLAFVGGSLGVWVYSCHRALNRMEAAANLGASVRIKGPFKELALHPAVWIIARPLSDVSVTIWDNPFATPRLPEICRVVGELSVCEEMSLEGSKISDSELTTMIAGKQLTFLFLENTSVTDQGFLELESMRTLDYLILKNNPSISEAAIRGFQFRDPLVSVSVRK